MAVNYKKGGTDLDSLCERYVCSSAGMTNYKLSGSSIASRYQKPNTDSWAQTINTGYYVNGTEVITCAMGYLPKQTEFARVTSGSSLSITRSDSGITIGSVTYGPSSFRNSVVPKIIGILLCGGGGGGGGVGYDKGNKSGYNVDAGGGGGGGGIYTFVLNLTTVSNISLTIGSGGAGGANGSSSSRPSSGSNGSDGTDTKLNYSTRIWLYGKGGKGGVGGVGDSSRGAGGAGGAGTHNSYGSGLSPVAVSGGAGGSCNNNTTSGGCNLSRVFSTVDGNSSTSLFFSTGQQSSYGSGDSYRKSYAGGGSSFGVGGELYGSTSPGYGGGGAASGYGSQSGGGGIAVFYY